MAIKTKATALTTTRATITLADTDITSKGECWVMNLEATGGASVWIGGADVTVANGFTVLPQQTHGPIELKNNETLYGITNAAGGATVRVLQTQV